MSYLLRPVRSVEDVLAARDLFFPEDIFERELWCVVQNRNLEQWLKLALAGRYGVSADLHFTQPERCIRSLGEEINRALEGDALRMPYADEIQFYLYHRLPVLLNEESLPPEYEDLLEILDLNQKGRVEFLSTYLEGRRASLAKYIDFERRLIWLSSNVAGYLARYLQNFLPMVQKWQNNQNWFDERPASGVENWQRLLLEDFFSHNEVFTWPDRFLEYAAAGFDHLPQRSYVLIGSAFLSEVSLRFFRRLAGRFDVIHYYITPFDRPFEPAERQSVPGRLWGKMAIEQAAGIAALDVRPDALPGSGETGHRRAGGQGAPAKQPGSLKCLQQIIRSGHSQPPADDGSLAVISTAGKYREIEILKDRILALFAADDSLQLTDIGVLAGDINDYAEFVEAVFMTAPDRQRLRYNLVDLGNTTTSALLKGWHDLADVWQRGRYTLADIEKLLQNKCIRPAAGFSENEVTRLIELCEKLNIRWGLDQEHRSRLGLGSTDACSWQQGRRRIGKGWFFRPASTDLYTGDHFSIEDEGDMRLFNTLESFLDSLAADGAFTAASVQTVDEWCRYCTLLLDNWFFVNDDVERSERRRLEQAMNNIKANAWHVQLQNEAMPWSAFTAMLFDDVSLQSFGRGQYLTGGITFSSIKPLRNVPFRHVFILGLDEDRFPAPGTSSSLDLLAMRTDSVIGQGRNWDRFSFLEAVLCARESLTLFYTGRDIFSGEELSPSVLIKELQTALEEAGGSLQRQSCPPHSYSPEYFDGRFTTYNRAAWLTRQALDADTAAPAGLLTARLGDEDDGVSFEIASGSEHAGSDLSGGQPAVSRSDESRSASAGRGGSVDAVFEAADLEWFFRGSGSYYYRNVLQVNIPSHRESSTMENWSISYGGRADLFELFLDQPSVEPADLVARSVSNSHLHRVVDFNSGQQIIDNLSLVRQILGEHGLQNQIPVRHLLEHAVDGSLELPRLSDSGSAVRLTGRLPVCFESSGELVMVRRGDPKRDFFSSWLYGSLAGLYNGGQSAFSRPVRLYQVSDKGEVSEAVFDRFEEDAWQMALNIFEHGRRNMLLVWDKLLDGLKSGSDELADADLLAMSLVDKLRKRDVVRAREFQYLSLAFDVSDVSVVAEHCRAHIDTYRQAVALFEYTKDRIKTTKRFEAGA